jgi:hypothetical protein
MEDMRNVQKIFVETQKGRDHLEHSWYTMEDNIKMSVNGTVCEGAEWIDLAHSVERLHLWIG